MSTSPNTSPVDTEQLRRWRLILGKDSQESLGGMCGGAGLQLSDDQRLIDEALPATYAQTESDGQGKRSAGLEKSSPRLAKWLGDIRTYFKEDVVTVIQQDAIERRGLKQLLFEPETLKSVQPNIALV